MREVRHDHDRLVENGRVRFGLFDRPIGDVNLDEADAFAPLPIPKLLRRLRLKEWQAFQITHPRFFIIIALFDAKLVTLAQVKLYDRQTGIKHMLEKKLLPGSFKTPRNLLDSVCEWRRGGEFIRFHSCLNEGRISVDFHIEKTRKTPSVTASLVADASTTTPMVVSIPFAENRGMYSHKALLPVEGAVTIGDERIDVPHGTGSLMTDDHKGYYGRIMTWDWLVGAAWRDGQLEGFNLTANASTDPERYHENGFWRGGELHHLPPVTFTRDEESSPAVWTVRDKEGLVDVRFTTEVDGRLFMNLGVMESRYLGPFGTYEGSLRSPDGATLDISGMFGMGERFWLKA